MAISTAAIECPTLLRGFLLREPETPLVGMAHLIGNSDGELGQGEKLYLAAWQEAEREGLE